MGSKSSEPTSNDGKPSTSLFQSFGESLAAADNKIRQQLPQLQVDRRASVTSQITDYSSRQSFDIGSQRDSMSQALPEQAAPKFATFSMSDVMSQQAQMEEKARAELVMLEEENNQGIDGSNRTTEEYRHAISLRSALDQAETEAVINKNLYQLLNKQLKSSLKEVERGVQLLTDCIVMDANHGKELQKLVNNAKNAIDNSSDDCLTVLASCWTERLDLHARKTRSNSRNVELLNEVCSQVRDAWHDMDTIGSQLNSAVNEAIHQLNHSFSAYQNSVKHVEDKHGRGKEDYDPWSGSLAVLNAHVALRDAQTAERGFLAAGAAKVARLEDQKYQAIQESVTGILVSEAEVANQWRGQVTNSLGLCRDTKSSSTDMQQLIDAAGQATECALDSANLSNQLIDNVSKVVWSSAEVSKQAIVEQWDQSSAQWLPVKMVLTRCRRLYLLRSTPQALKQARSDSANNKQQPQTDSVVVCNPLAAIYLPRSSLENSAAPVFSIKYRAQPFQLLGRAHTVCVRCSSWKECCEWVAIIRACSKGNMVGGGSAGQGAAGHIPKSPSRGPMRPIQDEPLLVNAADRSESAAVEQGSAGKPTATQDGALHSTAAQDGALQSTAAQDGALQGTAAQDGALQGISTQDGALQGPVDGSESAAIEQGSGAAQAGDDVVEGNAAVGEPKSVVQSLGAELETGVKHEQELGTTEQGGNDNEKGWDLDDYI